MRMYSFLGLEAVQWLLLIAALLTLFLLADAFAGHYRSGFSFRVQFAPFFSGALLIVAAVLTLAFPFGEWLGVSLRIAGWTAIASGIVGFGFHHYYGIAKKPGGYDWLLHYLMYGAPQLAPLGLSAAGTLALITARRLAGETEFAGFDFRFALLGFVAVALLGAILQAGVLHYRGAFNNPLMIAPLTVPLLTVFISLWAVFAPNDLSLTILTICLWLTLLTGFIGLGMHLRGFDRQMGGLYVAVFNWLEGPPAFAPALFAGFAAVGLVAVYLF